MNRPDDTFRRHEGTYWPDLHTGELARPKRSRTTPWGTIILFAGVLVLFTALGCTMAPRVIAQVDACRPDCAVAPEPF